MNRTLVCGDIHGGHKALLQVFERCSFDYENDELVVLGDIVDGWSQTFECVEELMKVKNLIYILGNHDLWAFNWAKHDERENIWISQGGWNTLKSYNFKMPKSHIDFFENATLWVEDEEKDIVFVHGGIDPTTTMEKQKPNLVLWDRNLIHYAKKVHTREKLRAHDTNREYVSPKLTKYGEVFLGHTTTLTFGTDKPIHYCNIWNLDTGGGWHGKLTIMDLETRKYWQSDLVQTLYPDSNSRGDYSRYDKDIIKWLDGG